MKDNTKETPILRIPSSDRDVANLQESLEQVLPSGPLALGPQTARLESLFKDFTGAKYAVAASNGTASLEVIIRSLDIEGKSLVVHTGGPEAPVPGDRTGQGAGRPGATNQPSPRASVDGGLFSRAAQPGSMKHLGAIRSTRQTQPTQ